MRWVYILYTKERNRLCIGSTNDLKRRIVQHQTGKVTSTSRYTDWRLVYCEGYLSAKDAYNRESQLKRFAQAYDGLKKRIADSLRTIREE